MVSPKNSLPQSAKSLLRIEFVTRTGTENVQVQNDRVTGKWKEQLKLLRRANAAGILADFANQPDPIQEQRELSHTKRQRSERRFARFIERYGPLGVSARSGEAFNFQLHDFTIHRDQLRRDWESLGRGSLSSHWNHLPVSPAEQIKRLKAALAPASERLHCRGTDQEHIHREIVQIKLRAGLEKNLEKSSRAGARADPVLSEINALRNRWSDLLPKERRPPLWLDLTAEDDVLVRSGDQLLYGAGTLYRFLTLALYSCPIQRLRKCHRPGCENPYFIARHLKSNYCSEVCARWGQAEAKRTWWQHSGTEWRRKRSKKK